MFTVEFRVNGQLTSILCGRNVASIDKDLNCYSYEYAELTTGDTKPGLRLRGK